MRLDWRCVALCVLAASGCSKSGDPAIDLEGAGMTRSVAREVLEGATTPIPDAKIKLLNSGNCALDYAVTKSTTDGLSWFNVTPTSGQVQPNQQPPPELTVTFTAAGLAPNTYTGNITITGLCSAIAGNRVARGSPAVVGVSLTVRPGVAELATDRPIVTADADSEPALSQWRTVASPPAEYEVTYGAEAAGFVVTLAGNQMRRYDPFSDAWMPVAASPAPFPPCSDNTLLGFSDRVVCLQMSSTTRQYVVYAYFPAMNTWTTSALSGARPEDELFTGAIVAAGSELLLLDRGLAFDVRANTWRALAPMPEEFRFTASRIYTGRELIVWGGNDNETEGSATAPWGRGFALDLASNSWREIRRAPIARTRHAAVWTGTRMFIYGGRETGPGTERGDGALYDPARDEWQLVPGPAFQGFEAVSHPHLLWTGRHVLLYGGYANRAGVNSGVFTNRGALLDPFPSSGLPTWVRETPQSVLTPAERTGGTTLSFWLAGRMLVVPVRSFGGHPLRLLQ